MGNPKLRLSEIVPNSWFHKLNETGNPKSTKTHHQPTKKNHSSPSQTPPSSATGKYPVSELQGELPLSPAFLQPLSPARKSYHFKRELPNPRPDSINDSPEFRNSSRRRRRKPITQKAIQSETFTQMVASTSNSRNLISTTVINDERSNFQGRRKTGDSVSDVELPPIKTERVKFSDLVKKIGGGKEAIDEKIETRSSGKCRGRRANGSLSVNVVREESSMASPVSSYKEQGSRSVRRLPNGSPRIRIRIHSPRLARRAQLAVTGDGIQVKSKKGLSSKSLAVVKSSSDPQRDFWESMVEMIVENDIRATKDLEELLACYLSLNSDRYHDLIIQVFTHIWFHLNNILKTN